ncbi:MAG: hypothetical protein A4E30_01427 [Methanomassiliicoccales archaeon PtaB.Bin215]|nr:MAG: hypothetical protein A4E30_01427 [Methanomassiliicoccales archaeon PtaB.Bin215]
MAITARNQIMLSKGNIQSMFALPVALIKEIPVTASTVATREKRKTMRSQSQAFCSMLLMRRYSSALSAWAMSPCSCSGV